MKNVLFRTNTNLDLLKLTEIHLKLPLLKVNLCIMKTIYEIHFF